MGPSNTGASVTKADPGEVVLSNGTHVLGKSGRHEYNSHLACHDTVALETIKKPYNENTTRVCVVRVGL